MLLLKSESNFLVSFFGCYFLFGSVLLGVAIGGWTSISQILDVVMEQVLFERYLDLTSEEESSKWMTMIAQ